MKYIDIPSSFDASDETKHGVKFPRSASTKVAVEGHREASYTGSQNASSPPQWSLLISKRPSAWRKLSKEIASQMLVTVLSPALR